MDWGKALEIAITAGATLLAAYFGARAAFAFNRGHEADRERRHQVEECNRALLVLVRQYNQLTNFRLQLLEPTRDQPMRHILMPPSEIGNYAAWTVNVPALSFLLQTDAGELPFMLALADQRFHAAVGAMHRRSKLHHEFQEKLASVNPAEDEEWPIEKIAHFIGPRHMAFLKQATDDLYAVVDESLRDHERIGQDAKRVLRTLYRGRRFIAFGPDPDHSPARAGDPPASRRGS